MKIAITGATGHIGANLCPLLLERAHEVRVLINSTPLNYRGLRQINGSILNTAAIKELVEGVDVVVHLPAHSI